MSKHFSVDEMKQHIVSILPSNSTLIDFLYDAKCFGYTETRMCLDFEV